ncbi:MAG: porin [Pseudomonadales bacterium]|nr:porin [Pseudomonadales bacterium]
MKTLNKTLLATAVGMAMTSTAAQAEIELGKGISVTGFVDMSFVYTDDDSEDVTEKVFGVDQVEADFMYKGADGISAQVDIEYGEGENEGEGEKTFVEQAFITKAVTDELSFKAGRFLSYSGWETEEPTGLYQYSGTGYGGYFYGGYQQGVSAYFDGAGVDFMASVVNSLAGDIEDDTTQLAAELGVAIEPMDGLTAKLFYITEGETDLINFWTSFSVEALTLAFEYNTAEYEGDAEGDGFLLMANYAMDAFGITVRYHEFEIEDGAGNTTDEQDAITIAPSYAMSDNLLIVAEYRMDSNGDDNDVDTFALEALYTY